MTVIIIMAVIRAGRLNFAISTEIAKTTTPTPATTYNNICIETNAFNDNDIKFYIFGRSPKNYATSSSLCSASPRLNSTHSLTLCPYNIHTIHNGMDWNGMNVVVGWSSTRSVCLYFLGWCTTCMYVCVSEQNWEKKKNKNTHRIVRYWSKCTQFHEPWAMSHDHAIHYYCFNAKIIAATMFSRILMCACVWVSVFIAELNIMLLRTKLEKFTNQSWLTSTLKWSTHSHVHTSAA